MLTGLLFHRGIGLETTVLFLREGASVLMADISVPTLQAAVTKINNIIPVHTGRLDHIRCDVSKEVDVAAMVAHVDSWGGVVSDNSHLSLETGFPETLPPISFNSEQTS